MRRSPNPWPIGLREPNPAGVRETRAVAVMVGHSEEVGSGYANAGGERYLVISVALVAVRACFRVRRRSTRTSTDGPPGSSVNPSRPALTTSEEPSNATTWEPNFRMGDIRPLRVTDTKKRIVPGGDLMRQVTANSGAATALQSGQW